MQAKQRGPAFTRKGRTKPEREGAKPERANTDKLLILISYNNSRTLIINLLNKLIYNYLLNLALLTRINT